MGSHGPKALVSSVHHMASWGGDLGPVKGWWQAWGGPWSAGRSPEPGQGKRDKGYCGNGSGGGQRCVLGPEGTVGPVHLPLPSSGLRNGTRPLSPARQAGPMGWGTARRHPPRASTAPYLGLLISHRLAQSSPQTEYPNPHQPGLAPALTRLPAIWACANLSRRPHWGPCSNPLHLAQSHTLLGLCRAHWLSNLAESSYTQSCRFCTLAVCVTRPGPSLAEPRCK